MNAPSLTNLLYILGAIFAFIIVCKIVSHLISVAIFFAIIGTVGYILYKNFNK